MGGEEHSAARRAKPPDHLPQLAARLWIEPGRRLVQEQQLGPAHQRARHGEALLLPARQLPDPRRAPLLELDEPEDLVHGMGARVEAAKQPHRLRDGQRSEEHTSELQSLAYLVCRLLLEKKKN